MLDADPSLLACQLLHFTLQSTAQGRQAVPPKAESVSQQN